MFEKILIESYSLGYLAYRLDVYLPFKSEEYLPTPSSDNCFVHLMRVNGLMSLLNKSCVRGKQRELEQCVSCYREGYLDALSGQKNKMLKKQKKVKNGKTLQAQAN